MNATLPGAMVLAEAGRRLKAKLPDPRDEHVLAAALGAKCSRILTFNLKDFPSGELEREEAGLIALPPDKFLVELLAADPVPVLGIVDSVRQRLLAPPMPWANYLGSLARSGLRETAELLHHLQGT